MLKSGTPALGLSLILFLIYFGNVSVGAARKPVFMGDVLEMLTLTAAAVCFVVGVLQKEKMRGD